MARPTAPPSTEYGAAKAKPVQERSSPDGYQRTNSMISTNNKLPISIKCLLFAVPIGLLLNSSSEVQGAVGMFALLTAASWAACMLMAGVIHLVRKPFQKKSASTSIDAFAYMEPDTERVCPFCCETIKAVAIKCRFCHSKIPTASEVPSKRTDRKLLVGSTAMCLLLTAFNATNAYSDIDDRISGVSSSVEELESSVESKASSDDTEDAKSEVDTVKSDLDSVRSDVSSVESDVTLLRSENDQLRADLDELRSELAVTRHY